MSWKQREIPGVVEIAVADALGPAGLAGEADRVTILPALADWDKLGSGALPRTDAGDVAKVMREGGIKCDVSPLELAAPRYAEKSGLEVLPTILVYSVLLPVVTGILASYLYDRIGRTRTKQTTVKSSLLVVRPDGALSLWEYQGPLDGFEDIAARILGDGNGGPNAAEPKV